MKTPYISEILSVKVPIFAFFRIRGLNKRSSSYLLGKRNAVMIDFFDYYPCAIDLEKNKISKTFLMVLRG